MLNLQEVYATYVNRTLSDSLIESEKRKQTFRSVSARPFFLIYQYNLHIVGILCSPASGLFRDKKPGNCDETDNKPVTVPKHAAHSGRKA